MKTKRLLCCFNLACCLIMISCSAGRKKESAALYSVRIDPKEAVEKSITEIADNFEAITFSDEELLNNINKMVVCGDTLIILDSKRGCLFAFVHNQLHTKLCNVGKGPNEYLGINDFLFDSRTGNLVVLDSKKKQIVKYSFNGDYIASSRIPGPAFSFYSDNFDDYYLYTRGISYTNPKPDDQGNIIQFSVSKDRIISSFFPFKRPTDLLTVPNAFFIASDRNVFFHYGINDTLYKLVHTGFIPFLVANISNTIPYSEIFKDPEIQTKRQGNIAMHGLKGNILVSNKYVFLNYAYQGIKYSVIFNTSTRKMLNLKPIKDDIFGTIGLYPIYLSDNKLFFVIESGSLKQLKSKVHIRNLHQCGDNPFIFVGQIKDF